MNIDHRRLAQIANRIREQLRILQVSRRQHVEQKLTNVLDRMERLQWIRRRLVICNARNWDVAAKKTIAGIESVFRELSCHIQDAETAIKQCDTKLPQAREIMESIGQVEDEFGNLKYVAREKYLTAVTEPIELEGVFLGEFEIRLHIAGMSDLRSSSLYEIVALEPNPAASNDSVTHPHVSDDRLCAGDAYAGIHSALAAGRICDFFLLVRSVLTQYNPDSPYVSLDNWDGVSCHECGYIMSSEDSHWCHVCEADYCGECSSYCLRCDDNTCLGCLTECAACQERICDMCMTRCPDCGRSLCEKCLDDNQCICIEESEEDDEHDENPTSESGEVQTVAASAGTENAQNPVPAATITAVHANSVGEVAVLP